MSGAPPANPALASTQTSAPVSLSEVRDLLIQARSANNEVNEQIPHAVELVRLGQDAGHLKLFVYGLAASMVILLATGWQLFLFLDGKVERKADYLNSRIDGLLQNSQSHSSYPQPSSAVVSKIDDVAAPTSEAVP